MVHIKKKILVADDDPAIVESIQMILETENYLVDCTVDGKVLQKIERNRPDLLLLDIWMSGVNGKDICRALKNNASTKSIPVILISASRDLKGSAHSAGADDFLEKPFEMEDLLKKVSEHL